MAVQFPANPVNNQEVTSGGITYVYDSAKSRWQQKSVVPAQTSAAIVKSSDRPLNPVSPTIWLDPDTTPAAMEIYIDGQWYVIGGGGSSGTTLVALTLSANIIAEGAAAGTVVGAVTNLTPGSTWALQDNAGGRFAKSGNNIVAGATATDYNAATSHQITVRETFAGASNSPRDTILTINVTDVVQGGELYEQNRLAAGTITRINSAGLAPVWNKQIDGAVGLTVPLASLIDPTVDGYPAGWNPDPATGDQYLLDGTDQVITGYNLQELSLSIGGTVRLKFVNCYIKVKQYPLVIKEPEHYIQSLSPSWMQTGQSGNVPHDIFIEFENCLFDGFATQHTGIMILNNPANDPEHVSVIITRNCKSINQKALIRNGGKNGHRYDFGSLHASPGQNAWRDIVNDGDKVPPGASNGDNSTHSSVFPGFGGRNAAIDSMFQGRIGGHLAQLMTGWFTAQGGSTPVNHYYKGCIFDHPDNWGQLGVDLYGANGSIDNHGDQLMFYLWNQGGPTNHRMKLVNSILRKPPNYSSFGAGPTGQNSAAYFNRGQDPTHQIQQGNFDLDTGNPISEEITGTPLALGIETTTLTGLTAGEAYRKVIQVNNGGWGPVTHDISAGALPTGAFFHQYTGVFHWPNPAGAYDFTWRVTDYEGNVATQRFQGNLAGGGGGGAQAFYQSGPVEKAVISNSGRTVTFQDQVDQNAFGTGAAIRTANRIGTKGVIAIDIQGGFFNYIGFANENYSFNNSPRLGQDANSIGFGINGEYHSANQTVAIVPPEGSHFTAGVNLLAWEEIGGTLFCYRWDIDNKTWNNVADPVAGTGGYNIQGIITANGRPYVVVEQSQGNGAAFTIKTAAELTGDFATAMNALIADGFPDFGA